MTPGGIDLNPGMLDLSEEGQSIQFNVDNAMFQDITPQAVNGIQPVILNITPIPHFAPLIGLSSDPDVPMISRNWEDR
jgi:hypothetical protein